MALKWRQEVLGEEERIREYCEKIAREGGKRIGKLLGTEVLGERSNLLKVRLPLTVAQLGVQEADGVRIARWIQEEMPDR